MPIFRAIVKEHLRNSWVIRHATRTSLISVKGNHLVPSRWARKRVRFQRYESHLELLEGQVIVDTIRLEYGRGKRIIRNDTLGTHERARLRTTATNPLQAKFEGLAPETSKRLKSTWLSAAWATRETVTTMPAQSHSSARWNVNWFTGVGLEPGLRHARLSLSTLRFSRTGSGCIRILVTCHRWNTNSVFKEQHNRS